MTAVVAESTILVLDSGFPLKHEGFHSKMMHANFLLLLFHNESVFYCEAAKINHIFVSEVSARL